MFASSREIALLFVGLALAGLLMAAGIIVAIDRLMTAGQPVAVDAPMAQASR
jgi:hypothetical protein